MPQSQSAFRGGGSRRRTLVPEARNGIQNMKMEAAQALGVQIPSDGYYGFVTARDAGSLGGYITKNLIAMAEQQLSSGQLSMGGMAGGSTQMGGQTDGSGQPIRTTDRR